MVRRHDGMSVLEALVAACVLAIVASQDAITVGPDVDKKCSAEDNPEQCPETRNTPTCSDWLGKCDSEAGFRLVDNAKNKEGFSTDECCVSDSVAVKPEPDPKAPSAGGTEVDNSVWSWVKWVLEWTAGLAATCTVCAYLYKRYNRLVVLRSQGVSAANLELASIEDSTNGQQQITRTSTQGDGIGDGSGFDWDRIESMLDNKMQQHADNIMSRQSSMFSLPGMNDSARLSREQMSMSELAAATQDQTTSDSSYSSGTSNPSNKLPRGLRQFSHLVPRGPPRNPPQLPKPSLEMVFGDRRSLEMVADRESTNPFKQGDKGPVSRETGNQLPNSSPSTKINTESNRTTNRLSATNPFLSTNPFHAAPSIETSQETSEETSSPTAAASNLTPTSPAAVVSPRSPTAAAAKL